MEKLNLRKEIIFCLLGLSSCEFKEKMSSQKLHDKVLTYAVGFLDDVQTNLHAASKIPNFNSNLSATFKTISQTMIFSNIQPEDRVKVYKDYIQCIESKDFQL